MQTEEVIYQSFLARKKKKGFENRYFVLCADCLRCYETEQEFNRDEDPRAMILLEDISSLASVDNVGFNLSVADKELELYCLALSGKTKEQSFARWKAAFEVLGVDFGESGEVQEPFAHVGAAEVDAEDHEAEMAHAATKVQAMFRGKVTRRKNITGKLKVRRAALKIQARLNHLRSRCIPAEKRVAFVRDNLALGDQAWGKMVDKAANDEQAEQKATSDAEKSASAAKKTNQKATNGVGHESDVPKGNAFTSLVAALKKPAVKEAEKAVSQLKEKGRPQTKLPSGEATRAESFRRGEVYKNGPQEADDRHKPRQQPGVHNSYPASGQCSASGRPWSRSTGYSGHAASRSSSPAKDRPRRLQSMGVALASGDFEKEVEQPLSPIKILCKGSLSVVKSASGTISERYCLLYSHKFEYYSSEADMVKNNAPPRLRVMLHNAESMEVQMVMHGSKESKSREPATSILVVTFNSGYVLQLTAASQAQMIKWTTSFRKLLGPLLGQTAEKPSVAMKSPTGGSNASLRASSPDSPGQSNGFGMSSPGQSNGSARSQIFTPTSSVRSPRATSPSCGRATSPSRGARPGSALFSPRSRR